TIMVKKHIVFQVVLSLFATFLFIYDWGYIHQHYTPTTIVLILIGLIGNFVMAIGIIMLAYTDVLVKKLLALLLRIAHKMKLFRKLEQVELNKHVDEFVKNIDDIKKNSKAMVGLVVVTLMQLIAYFSVTYFVYLGIGERGAHYMDILAVQVLVYMIASFIPTPGNAGASEGGFYVIFQPFFDSKILLYAMAIWRLITFYGLMLLSGVVVLLVKIYGSVKNKNSTKPFKE
ncbi:MAG: flippase-like domain-containing protein, partial [Vallitaleaceae bacterium]|nr:flippase-like domain-containing protein [Vallitaleaceae bacterium]